MTNAGRLWRLIQERLPDTILQDFDKDTAPTRLQAQILSNRLLQRGDHDHQDVTALRRWCFPDAGCIADPLSLPDMQIAVRRIRHAIDAGERICLVGDCDVDGITATVIMLDTLRQLLPPGAPDIPWIIQSRESSGRGLNQQAVEALVAQGTQLCITVDNGSSSHDEVAQLIQHHIDVIITDHHHLDDPPPAALAIVNPQRAGASYPNPDICGAGVALQLARALLGDDDLTDPRITAMLDLAGMGTLADVVRLSLENRTLIRLGLQRINTQPRVGIQAMIRTTRRPLPLVPRDISFGIAPRLNAVGRMGKGKDPDIAVEVLRTHDVVMATTLAAQLDYLNSERQRQTEDILAQAIAQARSQLAGDGPLFVRGQQWPVGLLGLIAGRLATIFDRLAVVISIDDDGACRGSLRGPEGFHIAETLATFDPPLAQAGGHAQAGGFTTTIDQLDRLRDHLAAAYREMQRQSPNIAPVLVDAAMPLKEITWDRVRQVRDLEPFGGGFAEPIFVSEQVHIDQIWQIQDGRNAKIRAEKQGQRRTFFWRGGGTKAALLPSGSTVDIIWQMPQVPASDYGEPEPYVVAIYPPRDDSTAS
jgi:single-stranded-DNA-specific exonuclease